MPTCSGKRHGGSEARRVSAASSMRTCSRLPLGSAFMIWSYWPRSPSRRSLWIASSTCRSVDAVPVTLQLVAEPPFSLEKTVRALQRLPINEIEVWEGGGYRRLLLVDDHD